MSDVQVTAARLEERGALANLMQFYVHDFSEYWSGTPKDDLQDDGRFPEYPLDIYWHDTSHVALLLRLDDRLIGFALLNDSAHSGRPVERNMAEFFIARKYRRSGLGTAAARQIFSNYPGLWETAVARRNIAALNFWRNAIRHHPLVEDVEEADLTTSSWNGPVLRFRIRQPALSL
jgi:predicted acetyltransferase